MQLVLPESFRKHALEGCHDDLGHLEVELTIDLLRDHFYWPEMINDANRHIKQCERCLRFKEKPKKGTQGKHRCNLSHGTSSYGLFDN